MTEYNKLVRDRIPEIVTNNGEVPITRLLGEQEYRQQLLVKLVEEAIELKDSDGALEERADIEEVLLALDDVLGLTRKAIENARAQKESERGNFDGRIYLERTGKRS